MSIMKNPEEKDKERTGPHRETHDKSSKGRGWENVSQVCGCQQIPRLYFATTFLPLFSSPFAILLMGKMVVTCTQSSMARRILVNRRRSEKL